MVGRWKWAQSEQVNRYAKTDLTAALMSAKDLAYETNPALYELYFNLVLILC